jgi:hypothetical protein
MDLVLPDDKIGRQQGETRSLTHANTEKDKNHSFGIAYVKDPGKQKK